MVIGDLNTAKRNKKRFEAMLETLDMEEFPLEEERTFTYDNLNSWNKQYSSSWQLDYVLLNTRNTKTQIKKQFVFRPFRKDKEGKKVDLADHYGILAEIELK